MGAPIRDEEVAKVFLTHLLRTDQDPEDVKLGLQQQQVIS